MRLILKAGLLIALTTASCKGKFFGDEASDKANENATTDNPAEDNASFVDSEAPSVDGKDLTSSEITVNSIKLTWDAATDDKTSTEELTYSVYMSTSPLSGVDAIVAGASKVSGDLVNELSFTVTGLDKLTTYYFYIIVSDSLENKSAYAEVSATTSGFVITSAMSASVVLGQPDFTSNAANRGGVVAINTLNIPEGIVSDGTRVAIADRGNHRVLLYNSIPTTNGASPDFVLGQPNFDTATAGCNDATLKSPRGIGLFDGKIFAAGAEQSRILIWDQWPSANGESANVVIGRSDFITCSNEIDDYANVTEYTLSGNYALGLFAGHDKLLAAEHGTGRVTIFEAPFSTGMAASAAVGAADFISQDWGTSATQMKNVLDAWTDGTIMCAAEGNGNNRVLIYNSIPTGTGAAADVVLGQPDFTSAAVNRGGSPAANTLNEPHSCLYTGSQFVVADTGNNRILIWNGLPTTNGQPADIVLGQDDFTSGAANRGATTDDNTFSKPAMVRFDGNALYIGDMNNNRVLIYK